MIHSPIDFLTAGQIFSRLEDLYLSPNRHPRSRNTDRSRAVPINKKDHFQLLLNIKHFSKKEVQVKIVEDALVIHAKHEEQPDEHGFVSREFTRRITLPENVDPKTVRATLSQEGMLTISASLKKPDPPANETIIEITVQPRVDPEEAKILAQESISLRREEARKDSEPKQDEEKQEPKSQPQDAEK